jgi:aspartate aminotransferase
MILRPPELSHRAIALKPSLTLEISAKAKRFRPKAEIFAALVLGA